MVRIKAKKDRYFVICGFGSDGAQIENLEYWDIIDSNNIQPVIPDKFEDLTIVVYDIKAKNYMFKGDSDKFTWSGSFNYTNWSSGFKIIEFLQEQYNGE